MTDPGTYKLGEIHSFDAQLAIEFGLEEAVLIKHFQHWISINKRMGRNKIEGKTWSYQSQEWMAAHFIYFNRKKLGRLIQSLVDKKVLVKNNFNKLKHDRTLWYAFVDENRFLPGVQDPTIKKETTIDKMKEE